MPFYIVLQFDDDQAAKDFGAKCFKTGFTDFGDTEEARSLTLAERYAFKVFGIWRKPTKFCQCGPGPGLGGGYGGRGGSKSSHGFTRSLGYGWWVCARCSKPTALWASGARWFTIFGKNLLPRALRIYKDDGDDSMMEWNWLENTDA